MIEERNPVHAMIFSIITLGIYAIYWFYRTSDDMKEESGRNISPGFWTLGLFVPIINFVIFWKYSHLVEEVVGKHSGALIFLFWVVIPPAGIYLVQEDLNEVAG